MAMGSTFGRGNSYPFPDENVNPKMKEDPVSWGLPLAKAIWYNRAFTNSNLFYNIRKDYYTKIDFALGLNDPNAYKPVLGVNPNEAQKTFIPNIDWSIKNYATKRVNIATAKITSRYYDPQLNPVDPISKNRKKNYKAKLKAYMDNQEYLQEMFKEASSIFPTPEEIDPVIMPQNDMELELHMNTDYKDEGASWIEERVNYFLDRNRYSDIKSLGAFDEFVLGVRIEHVDMDAYGRPHIRHINPANFICPTLESAFPVNLKYGADIEYFEVSDFRKFAEGDLTSDQIDIIIENHAHEYSLSYEEIGTRNNFYNTRRIEVMRFEFRSVDERVYVESSDPYGNNRFVERDYNFYRSESQRQKFEEKNAGRAKMYRKGIDTVYSGYWVVNTDYIIRYGRKCWQEGEWGALGQGRIGYKVVAPNLHDGRVISTVDQMIPVLNELQRYHLKIQHIIAASVPKGIGIDLEALRRAELKGPNGDMMTDLEKVKFYQQTGIFVFNPGDGSIYGRGGTQKPIYEVENGVAQDLVHYVSLIDIALRQLDEIIGINEVTAASPVHERKGVRVAQMQQQATETALWYLYEADEHIFKEVVKSLAVKAIQSELFNPEYYVEVFGESSANFIREYRLDKTDFGLTLEVRPSPEQWQEFYVDVKEAQSTGAITLSQAIMLRRIPNLRKAETMLRMFEERTRRQNAEAQQQQIQQNAEVQAQVAQQTHQFNMELEGMKQQGLSNKVNAEAQLEMIRASNRMKEMYAQAFIDKDLDVNKIRTQGDETAQIEMIKGEIDKEIEAMKLAAKPKEKKTAKAQ